MRSMYPMFEANRILKKEALTAIRDYSFDHAQLTYQDYSPGILTGCGITVHGSMLEISPGIMKYNNKILLLPEPEQVPYMATNCMQYLKARIEEEDVLPEYIAYQVTFILEQSEECKENEFELCRFHLRQGAKLRNQYKDFFDLDTEYDTINPIFSIWGGKNGRTLSPIITENFAEEILKTSGKRVEDTAFAYACLNQVTGMPSSVLRHYVNDWRSGGGKTKETNMEIYRGLCEILRAAQSGKSGMEAVKHERRKILIN